MINNWKQGIDYPEWMTEEGLKTLSKQHLLENETPLDMYKRVTNQLASRLDTTKFSESQISDIRLRWLDYLWNGWLAMSTPVASNTGTTRGMSISCFIQRVDDTLDSIYEKVHELAMLTKAGGGLGTVYDKVRAKGTPISVGGFSEGVIPFIKVNDSAIIAASQGSTRRGSQVINLPVRHGDIEEFLRMRQPKGDVNRQCLNVHHCVTIDDFFMESLKNGDQKSRDLWAEIISLRMKTGEPYIMYYHNAHNQRPQDMVSRKLKIDGTNLCSEIMLPSDAKHTVVCCLSSVNMVHFDKWLNVESFIPDCLLFLDCVITDFVELARNKPGFQNAVRFAEKSRSLGLGVLGFASYIQQNNQPYISFFTRGLIHKLGKAFEAGKDLYTETYAKLLGSPEWCDTNRNLTHFAIAPNTTSSIIAGGVSQGIEPIIANIYVHKTAKGTFIRMNPQFKHLLETKYPEYNNMETYNSVAIDNKGSVQHLHFLTDEEKEVFLTAYEINQLELVKQIALIQKFIDQGISTNLFFPADVDPKWVNKVHLTAWEEGLKSLYYVRTESIASRSMSSTTFSDCIYCE